MTRMKTLLCSTLLSSLMALTAACGGGNNEDPNVISASSYSATCSMESDCVEIFVGDQCACQCQYAAINRSDLPRYQADRARIYCPMTQLCQPCQSASATCTAGRCAIK
jgi:hypothetical protein